MITIDTNQYRWSKCVYAYFWSRLSSNLGFQKSVRFRMGENFVIKFIYAVYAKWAFFILIHVLFYVTFMHFFASTRPSGAPLVPTPFCIGEELLQTRWYLKINALAILGKSTKDSYPRVPEVKSFIFGEELPKISSFWL